MAILKLGLNAGSGFASLSQQLKQLSEKSKGLFHDTERLQESTSNLSKSFSALGIGALGALGVIAAIAPSLAGALASLEVSGFRVAEAIGKAAMPAFEGLAGVMEGVATFLEQNPWAAELTAGLLGLAAVVKVGGFLYSGLMGVVGAIGSLGTAAMGVASGPAAPLIILAVAIVAAHELLKDFKTDMENGPAMEWVKELPIVGGVLGYGAEAVMRTGEAIGQSGGRAGFQGLMDATGVSGGLMALGSILGLNEMTAEDIAAENFKNTNPVMQAAGMASILIQIIDQDGEKRDQIVVTGGGGGTR